MSADKGTFDNVSVKQYVVTLAAGVSLVGSTPANKRRLFLELQNTGANPAYFRFENSVQLDGGDFVIAPFEVRTYYYPCPIERLNYLSPLGTSLAVIEGTRVLS